LEGMASFSVKVVDSNECVVTETLT
jgi:hypothetical protein